MLVEVSKATGLEEHGDGQWRFRRWGSRRLVAGVVDRHGESAQLLAGMGRVEAEQVHGGSVAIIERVLEPPRTVAGCDALLTHVPAVVLLVRSADCLPIFFADPSRGVIGLAHVGWRGLAARLPARVVAAYRHAYHGRPDDLHVAIGPAIRACCYEVGPEFAARFPSFLQDRGGRRTCDLVGAAAEELRRCGVRSDRLLDSRWCTACDLQRWFSLRREGPSTGRLTSFIMLRP